MIASNKPVAVHFGGGNIGRGFIGALLSQAGFHVIFADVQEDIINALNKEHGYDLHLLDSDSRTERIEDVRGVLSTNLEEIEKIAKEPISIITTAVGANVLPNIAKPVAQIIKTRMATKKGPINIIACENEQQATATLQEAVEKELDEKERQYARDNVGFAICAVDRIAPSFKGENMLEVRVEPFYEWTVDANSLKKTDPDVEIKGMHTTDNLDAYVQRKLFTLNCGHAITAYLGFLAHKPTILDAIKTPFIHSTVSKALHESGTALVKKHSKVFNESDHNKFIETTLHRFANPHLHDEVTRVGKEPLRKLKQGDRLVGPIEMCREYDLPREGLLTGLAAALLFNPSEDSKDEEAKELQEKISQKGVKDVALEFTGWKDGDEDLKKVLEQYEKLKGNN